MLCLIPLGVVAQTSYIVEPVGSQLGLNETDAKTVTLNILRWVLGIMALVAVAMIIFSGVIAVTSGDSEKGAVARRVISGAIIGLIIVLLAWAIVIFVARTTVNVTN